MCKNKSLSFLLSFFIIAFLLASQQVFAQPQQTAVPVEKEPHHPIVFENKNVRIYDALIPPGEATLFHTHSFDNVAVAVSGGMGRNEPQGMSPTPFSVSAGWVGFSKATNAPYTHRLTNAGATPLRFVTAEILSSSASPVVPAVLNTIPGHVLVLQNDRMTVYRILVDPKQSTGTRSRMLPWLRISVSQSTISIQRPGKSPEILDAKPGDYRWYEGPTTDSIENIGSTKYEAIEIELK